MNSITNSAGDSDGRLDPARTEQVLREALNSPVKTEGLEQLPLDPETVAAFIADQATFLSAIAEAAGFPKVRILCDVLYVRAFGDFADNCGRA